MRGAAAWASIVSLGTYHTLAFQPPFQLALRLYAPSQKAFITHPRQSLRATTRMAATPPKKSLSTGPGGATVQQSKAESTALIIGGVLLLVLLVRLGTERRLEGLTYLAPPIPQYLRLKLTMLVVNGVGAQATDPACIPTPVNVSRATGEPVAGAARPAVRLAEPRGPARGRGHLGLRAQLPQRARSDVARGRPRGTRRHARPRGVAAALARRRAGGRAAGGGVGGRGSAAAHARRHGERPGWPNPKTCHIPPLLRLYNPNHTRTPRATRTPPPPPL